PMLVFSPAAGWLCDRFDRRKLMIGSELLSGLVISGLIFARQPAVIYALLALQAITTALMTPARQAVVPQVVPQEELTRANAFLQQLAGIIKIAAPSLAGLVLTLLSPHQAIILDVVSFGLSALILSRLPALPPVRAEHVESSSSSAKAGGAWAALRASPGLKLLFAGIFLAITVIVGFDVISPVYIRDVLRGGESLFGLMISLVGVGTLAVTLLLMLRPGASSPWRDLAAGLGFLALLPLLLAGAAALHLPASAAAITAAGAFLGGIGNGLVNVQSGTLLQSLSPRGLLGRMGGLFQSTAVAGQLVGTLATPLIVPGLLPMGIFFWLMAAGLILVALATAAFSLRLPQMARTHTDRA
ncbi:MAG TPA: MFS transporter, partial [Anaerolineaceae bacterium]